MNTTSTARSLFSVTTGLGLATFTAIAFVTAGIAAPATVMGFSFLAVYGMFEIALLDSAPPARVRAVRPAGTVVHFSVPACNRRAA
jgi:hypothetical protein